MTPKEKAIELINKYMETDLKPFSDYGYYMDKDAAKKCALITVDEIQEILMLIRKRLDISDAQQLKINDSNIVYSILWFDNVKEEVEKL